VAGVDFNRIRELVEARNSFIEQGPPERRERLRNLQAQIDARLDKVGKKNRLAMIQSMMFESVRELQRELNCLRS